MKKIIKNISIGIVGLFIFFLSISVIWFITSWGWNILHMQTCTYDSLPKNATCEEIAQNNANNCKYTILRWKKIDYNKELQECQEWKR